jgi:hypothetical protein
MAGFKNISRTEKIVLLSYLGFSLMYGIIFYVKYKDSGKH